MSVIKEPKVMQENIDRGPAKTRIWKPLRILVIERPEIVLAPLLFVVLVGGWELAVKVFEIPRIVLPAPSAIARAIVTFFAERNLAFHFGVTLYETLAGFLIGGITGLFLGTLVSQFPLVEKTLYPYIVAFQTLPKVAIAPIIIIDRSLLLPETPVGSGAAALDKGRDMKLLTDYLAGV